MAKGGTATFSVKLATKPTANVPVNITEYGDRLGTLSQNPASLTFTPNNWNTAQTITVTSANTPEGTSGNEANLMVRTGNTDDLSGYYNLPWVWQRVYEFDPPAIWLASRTVDGNRGRGLHLLREAEHPAYGERHNRHIRGRGRRRHNRQPQDAHLHARQVGLRPVRDPSQRRTTLTS